MTTLPTPKNLSPDHMLTLYQISGVMNSSLEFDEALTNVMDAIMLVTKAQRGFLMINDERTHHLDVLVSRGIDGQTITEEGYSTTIVNKVVETHAPLLTNNAQYDTRFTAGQSIIMRGLRAILCAPMLVGSRLVGVVYVDTAMKSGNFTESDRDLLNAVAGQAGRAIENARLYREAIIKGRMERELQMASEIQRGLLPHIPTLPKFEIVPQWQAAREVAGDFYDVFRLDDNTFGVVIADVSDKGAPAAMFMAVARTFIRSHAHAGMSALDTMRRTNDLILEDAESGMFVTVYHSLFRVDGQSVHVNAGHNPPLVYRHKTKEISYMPRGGRAIGWFPDLPVEEIALEMQPGDVIVYYTDGLTEAENPQGDFYGEGRLAQAMAEIGGKASAQEILNHILKSVETFCAGAPPFDDLTMMIVKYTG
jgi:sigma-B regulation protein RsbU (phosphoserine phosphatase)